MPWLHFWLSIVTQVPLLHMHIHVRTTKRTAAIHGVPSDSDFYFEDLPPFSTGGAGQQTYLSLHLTVIPYQQFIYDLQVIEAVLQSTFHSDGFLFRDAIHYFIHLMITCLKLIIGERERANLVLQLTAVS